MLRVLWLALITSISLPVLAAANITLTMRAEQEIRTVINDEVLIRYKAIQRVRVGDVVTITINYHNDSDSDAHNVKIDNPIPTGARFVLGSGFGEKAQFLVSYDNGLSFDDDIKIRKDAVTHVRWLVDDIPARTQGEVGFKLYIEDNNAQL